MTPLSHANALTRFSPMPETFDASGTPFAYDSRNALARWLMPEPAARPTGYQAPMPGQPIASDPAWERAQGSPWKRPDWQNSAEDWVNWASEKLSDPQIATLMAVVGPRVAPSQYPRVNSGVLPRNGVDYRSSRGVIVDPPTWPQRSFDVDYPAGAKATPTGRLTHDIDGRPINPDAIVVGRRDMGGPDEAVAATQAQVDAVSERLLGTRPEAIARREIGGDHGRFVRTSLPDGETGYNVLVARDLPDASKVQVSAHELGHGLDYFTAGDRGISTKGHLNSFKNAYNDLNNPYEHMRRKNPNKEIKKNFQVEPSSYKAQDVPGEYVAEALGWYMRDPNSFKAFNPGLAAYLRAQVNTSPAASRVHLNSLAAPAALAAPALLDDQGTLDLWGAR